jgi:hypothetical protein
MIYNTSNSTTSVLYQLKHFKLSGVYNNAMAVACPLKKDVAEFL